MCPGNLCAFGSLKCPAAPGSVTIDNEAVFPADAPNGNYEMKTIATDQDGAQVFCYSVKFTI